MKTFSYILTLLITLSSCSYLKSKKTPTELFSQDFKNSKADNTIKIINLDSVTNFSELITRMEELTCKQEVSGLKFELNDTIYHLTGYADCPTSNSVGCYLRRNVLYIKNDSLVINSGESKEQKQIKYLKTELNKIMAKTYTYQYNENKLKPALISLYVEDKYPILTTKKVLKEITKQFAKINFKNNPDFFKYHILFKTYDATDILELPIPMPPPQHINQKIDYN